MKKPFLNREERILYRTDTLIGATIRVKLANALFRKELKKEKRGKGKTI